MLWKMRWDNVGLLIERIAVDIAGPFSVTDDGNRYVMVIGDYFTKWVETYAIPDHEVTTMQRHCPYRNPYGSREQFRVRTL